MKDLECVAFLQWALPQLGLDWRGFRKVRRQVCRRIAARIRALGLADTAAYRERLESDRAEWPALAGLCTIPISRFYRDREVFDCLGAAVLPALAEAARKRGAERLECWSAGCASGEEPYTLALQWRMTLAASFPELERQDLLGALPQRQFDLILCRNVAFTYFSDDRARAALQRLASRLRVGGALVIGLHERLPGSSDGFDPWPGCRAVFRLRTRL